MYASSVVGIQTQGRADIDQWVKTFRIEYSRDCVHFTSLMGVNGNDMVRSCFFLQHILTYLFIKKTRQINFNFVLFDPSHKFPIYTILFIIDRAAMFGTSDCLMQLCYFASTIMNFYIKDNDKKEVMGCYTISQCKDTIWLYALHRVKTYESSVCMGIEVSPPLSLYQVIYHINNLLVYVFNM